MGLVARNPHRGRRDRRRPGRSARGRPVLGHDAQPRFAQACDQAISVDDRIDVARCAGQTNPGKGTRQGPGDPRATPHAASDVKPAAAGPRPAAQALPAVH